jgi:uncharacterized protein YgbK (DUF1537 family)
MKRSADAFALDPLRMADAASAAAEALQWADPRLGVKPVLIYSTAEPTHVGNVQERLGRQYASTWFERTLAAIAKGLVERGVTKLVVAGGETAGAVVGALGIAGLRIGSEIDPGVPWTTSLSNPPLALALKSGNFGADDFFLKAFR